MAIPTIAWRQKQCILLDQTLLPSQESYVVCTHYQQVVEAIQKLRVRGAPAIGVAGAFGAVLAGHNALTQQDPEGFFQQALVELRHSRPTAVNLGKGLDRIEACFRAHDSALTLATVEALESLAHKIDQEEQEFSQKMGEYGAALLPERASVLTICNTGGLATSGRGTALGVIERAFELGKIAHVYACETRPLLQGLRLTAWELGRTGIPFTMLCDGMAASLMANQKLDAVLVGADRIARNGDTANKIGTLTLAILAKQFGIPFLVVAPSSTCDRAISKGSEIPIEHRGAEEILAILGTNQHPGNIGVYNPSFDVTPAEWIQGIVTEKGVAEAPLGPSLSRILGED